MKKLILIFLFVIIPFLGIAVEDVADLGNKVDALTKEMNINGQKINRLQLQCATYNDSLKNLQEEVDGLRSQISANETRTHSAIDTVNEVAKRNAGEINDTRNATNVRIIVVSVIIILVVIALVIGSRLFYRKLKNSSGRMDELKRELSSQQEKIVDIDDKMIDFINNQLRLLKDESVHQNDSDKHKIVLSIATEITKIRQNLQFMDPGTRGVKSISNRTNAVLTILSAKGYEFPELLGKEYNEGDSMVPTMELDESIPIGKQIIKRVIKPQVNYNGKMIQAAEVVVGYNE